MNSSQTERALTQRRVLVVTNMYPDATNPDSGTYVRDQVEGLRARGLQVDVLLVGGKKRKLSYAQGLQRLWRHLGGPFPLPGRRPEHQYDIIHAHYVLSGIVARLQWRAPLVVTFHGEPIRSAGFLSKLLAPFVDAVIVTSLAHQAQIGRRDAYIVPCGVDLDLFTPAPKEEARQRLNLSLNAKLVLFAGMVRPEKRLDIIRAAVDLAHQEDERVELVIATGHPHDMMPLYMNACDVLVLASDYEGSPVVIKEAMACNLPIVSTDVGDVAQVIGATACCHICRQDPRDMAQKIMLALVSGQRTDGRQAILPLSSDRTLDKIIQVYEDVLGRTRKSVSAPPGRSNGNAGWSAR